MVRLMLQMLLTCGTQETCKVFFVLEKSCSILIGAIPLHTYWMILEIRTRMEKAHALKVIKKEDKLAAVDRAMKKSSNKVNDQISHHCTGDGLVKIFPRNNLQLMVKGNVKRHVVSTVSAVHHRAISFLSRGKGWTSELHADLLFAWSD